MSAFGYRKPSDLPRDIPLFPLSGALLLPRAGLPLNIFEPRYLNMIDDALAGERVIGMVQPSDLDFDGPPPLCAVGALGRITAFAETDDGRYLITLTGVCRFRITQELNAAKPYRRAIVDYEDFADDLRALPALIDRDRLLPLLRRYADQRGYAIDWAAVDSANAETIVNLSAALIPFDPNAKQALLEAPTVEARCDALIALLEWGDDDAQDGRPLQ